MFHKCFVTMAAGLLLGVAIVNSASGSAQEQSNFEFELEEEYTCRVGWADYCSPLHAEALEGLDEEAKLVCENRQFLSVERISSRREIVATYPKEPDRFFHERTTGKYRCIGSFAPPEIPDKCDYPAGSCEHYMFCLKQWPPASCSP